MVDDYGLGIWGVDLSSNGIDERDITERTEDLRHVRGHRCELQEGSINRVVRGIVLLIVPVCCGQRGDPISDWLSELPLLSMRR